jgi:glycosyltransferase involved in cell wall biosynthesis
MFRMFGEYRGLKTCLVHDWLTVAGGAEEVLKRVLEVIPATIIAAQYNSEKFPWVGETPVRSHWISKLPLSKTKHYIYAPFLGDVYRSLNLDEFDLVVTSSHSFSHNVRPRPNAINYCYYYTATRSLWMPEIDGRAGSGWIMQKIVNRLKKYDYQAAQQPTYITAISHTSAKRVEKFYGRPVDEVIYPPVEVEKFAHVKSVSTDAGYLIWGRQIKYKKSDIAVQAAVKLGFKLNIVGNGPELEKLKEMAAGVDNITFHGRLSDEDLTELMSRSKAFLFPGYEDFGIVVVEALAAGLPVIAYREGGASEILTPELGEFIQEQTPDSIGEAIQRFEKRTFNPDDARKRAQDFSVERFQLEFMASVDRAIERGVDRRFIKP